MNTYGYETNSSCIMVWYNNCVYLRISPWAPPFETFSSVRYYTVVLERILPFSFRIQYHGLITTHRDTPRHLPNLSSPSIWPQYHTISQNSKYIHSEISVLTPVTFYDGVLRSLTAVLYIIWASYTKPKSYSCFENCHLTIIWLYLTFTFPIRLSARESTVQLLYHQCDTCLSMSWIKCCDQFVC